MVYVVESVLFICVDCMRDVVKMGCVGWHSIYWAKASAGPGSPNWPVRFGTIDHDSFGVDRLCVVV